MGRHILVIDDHEETREALATVLRTLDHQVDVVESGERGIELSVLRRPEIVLVDLGLPGLDGLEVARRLRARMQTDTPTLVAFTGYGRPEDRERAREAGFDGFLLKPVSAEELQAAIATHSVGTAIAR